MKNKEQKCGAFIQATIMGNINCANDKPCKTHQEVINHCKRCEANPNSKRKGKDTCKCQCHKDPMSPPSPTTEKWEEDIRETYGAILSRASIEKTIEYWRGFISQIRTETEKAFGGCTKCYGKGYGTTLDFAQGFTDFGPLKKKKFQLPNMVFCKCGRGYQLEDEIKKFIQLKNK